MGAEREGEDYVVRTRVMDKDRKREGEREGQNQWRIYQIIFEIDH